MKRHMELKKEGYTMADGYTMKANVNPDCIKALKRWNKDDGKAIAEAIRKGDVKKAIYHLGNAKARNRQIRELSAKHDKIIYNKFGASVFVYDNTDRKCYELEQ